MRRSPGALGTLLALIGSVTLAQAAAAPEITGSFVVAPVKAGTKKKPRNGFLKATFNVNEDSDSTLSRIEYTVPPKVVLDGTGFETCRVDTLNQLGPAGCPKGSLVGRGSGTATLGPDHAPQNFTATTYVAGRKALALYMKTSLFNVAIPGTISGRTVGFDVPKSVQNPTGGPSGPFTYVTSVTAELGKQAGIPATTRYKKHTRYFVSIAGCPKSGMLTGEVKVFLTANPDPPPVPTLSGPASAPCS